MYDSQEIRRISKNLSLRFSPKRKLSPKPLCRNCCCFPCRCCHYCHCCPCCCTSAPLGRYNYSPLNIDSNSLVKNYSPNKNTGGTSNLMGSTNFSTYHSPTRLRNPSFNYNQDNSKREKVKSMGTLPSLS